MCYKCLRCGSSGEIRRGKKTGNNCGKYVSLETGMKDSKVLQLRRTTVERKLCLSCLEEISTWLQNKSTHLKTA